MNLAPNSAPLLYAPTLELVPTAEIVAGQSEQPGGLVLDELLPDRELTPEEERAHHQTGLAIVEHIMAEPKHLSFPRFDDVPAALKVFSANRERLAGWGEKWVHDLQDPAAVREYIGKLIGEAQQGRTLPYWIREGEAQEEGPIIGKVLLQGHVAEEHVAQLGAWIDEKYEAQGYVRRSALSLLEYAREVWGLRHVLANITLNNIRANKGVQRLGFDPLEIVPTTWLVDQRSDSGLRQWWVREL